MKCDTMRILSNGKEAMMSIYRRGKSWYYDFEYRGERYAGCIGPVSKTVAKEVLARKKAEAVEGRYISPAKQPSPLFEEIAVEYLQYYRANRRPRSAERHQRALTVLATGFSGKRLTEITPFLTEQYKRRRKDAGRSAATINRELTCLKHLFTMAITWGKASMNPATPVRLLREEHNRTRFLTTEEEERLLAACSLSLRPLVLTALYTGFRLSELLSLTWQDVDFSRRLMTVQAAYAKNGETRSAPMTATVTEALQTLPQALHSPMSVFLTRKGTPYRYLTKVFNTACRKAGLTDVTFHNLRHTFASRLVMAGADLPTVQALMGHKNIRMTMRYAHLSPEHKRAAIALLESFRTESPTNFPNRANSSQKRVRIIP
jgi:integrase